MTAVTTWRRVQRASSSLSTDAVRRMEALSWFSALSAEQRSWVGLVVQSGLSAFSAWYRDPTVPPQPEAGIFSAAPRQLARAVSLKQTVQLIRATVAVLEEAVPRLAAAGDEERLREAVLRYSREVAFAAAEVYATAAEERGGWDARLEASVVEALVRGEVGETALSRAAALGWGRPEWVTALAGPMPLDPADPVVGELRGIARHSDLCLLVGESGGRLLAVVGGTGPARAVLEQLCASYRSRPVLIGPAVDGLAAAPVAVREVLSALSAAITWPQAVSPIDAGQLLAERAVLGDADARRRLVEEVYIPLQQGGGDLLLTASAFLDGGSSLEGTARQLFVHANTVRYRLRRVADVCGRDLTEPRDAQVVRLALVVGRAAAWLEESSKVTG